MVETNAVAVPMIEAIGLKHHQDVVVKSITPGLRGQLKQVRHLVEVTPVKETRGGGGK